MIFKTNFNIGISMIDPMTGEYEKAGKNDNPGYDGYHIPSDTVPGMAMSIQDLLRRHAAGLPLDGQRVPFYEGDENMEDSELQGHPDLSKMDLVDRQEYIESQQQRLDDLRKKFANEKAQKSAIAERIKAQKADQGKEDAQPRDPKGTEQYPKKTRGAGAEPRDTQKGGEE